AFVSNAEYHTINLYKFDNSGQRQNFYINQQYQPSLQISGQLGKSGDNNSSPSLLNFPTGLSIAYNKTSTYVLVADTNNNKIKAIDISDLWSNKDETDYIFNHYTIAKSTHLNRPYKAIQKSPNSTNIFIANTFNNTIELLDVGLRDFKVLENFPVQSNIDGLAGSQNTRTSTGTGYARVDTFGNLFHPIDLAFNDDQSTLWVSSYTNHSYSLNSSFHLYTGKWIDKNSFSGSGETYTEENIFYTKNISLGNLSNESSIPENEQNIITVSNSNVRTLISSEGLVFPARSEILLAQRDESINNPAITNQISYLIVNKEGLNKTPHELWTKEMVEFKSYHQNTENVVEVSNISMSYQTEELSFSSGIAQSGATRVSATAKASILLRPKTQELIISPQHDLRSTYDLTTLEKQELPSFLIDETLGDPFYYDTTQDQIPDLFLPVPLKGIVYVFPGFTSSEPSVPPLTFDFTNYWYIDSLSLGSNCGALECLVGVRHVNTARIVGTGANLTDGSEIATRATLRGDDLIFVNPLKSTLQIVDSYAFSIYQTSTIASQTLTYNPRPITGMNDFNFHINQISSPDWFVTTTVKVSYPSATYWSTPGPAGTHVLFEDTDNPYKVYPVTSNISPYKVVAGHYTSSYLSQECHNSACLIGGHCYAKGQCAATNQNNTDGDDISNITYGWSLGVTQNTTSIGGRAFTTLVSDLINLEQILIIGSPDSDTGVSGLGIFGVNTGGDTLNLSLGNLGSYSKVYSGMIDSATSHSLEAMTWKTGATNFGSQAFKSGERARKDGILFFDITGAFQYKVVDNSNYQTIETLVNVYAEETKMTGCGLTSDFRIIDINDDQVSDLIALHPDHNTVSIHLGTGNKSESQFFTGVTTCDDIGPNVQVIPTLDKPSSIDILDSTKLSNGSFSNPEFIISYETSQSISVYTSSSKDGLFYEFPIHFNMGLSGLNDLKAVHRTDNIHTLIDKTNPSDFSSDVDLETASGIDIWNGYYFGVPNTSDPYYLTGIKESEVATAGVVFTQSIPLLSQGNVGGLTLVEDWIFRSTRSYFISTEGLNFYTAKLNNDNLDDIIVSDPYYNVFNILMSIPSNSAILFDPTVELYRSEGLIGGMAFGDINKDVKDDINNQSYDDIIVSNFSQDTITIFHNGGQSSSSSINPDFTFSHTSYPPTTVSVGNGPTGLTMADFDNDGYQDIAVSNFVGGNITILFNQGTIPPTFKSRLLPAGLAPKQIFAVDIDASIAQLNSSIDLVVINQDSNDVYVYKNNGSGQFSAPYIYPIADYFPTEEGIRDLSTGLLIDPNEEKSQDFLYGNIGSQGLSSLTTYNTFLVGKTYGISSFINTGDKSSSEYHSGISSYAVNLDGSLSFASVQQLDAVSVIKSLAFVDGELYFGSTSHSTTLSNPFLSSDGSQFTSATLRRWDLSSTLSAAPETATSISESSFFDLRKDQLGGIIEALATTKKPGSLIKELYYIHSGKEKTLQRILPSSQELISGVKKLPDTTNIATQFGNQLSFNHPAGLILDNSENTLLVADSQNNLVRIIDLESNVTRTLVIGSDNNYTPLTGVIDLVKEYNTFNYFAVFPNPGASLNKGLGLIRPSDDPNASFQFVTLDDQGTSITPANWFQITRYQQYLYIAENSNLINPSNGNIYEVDTSQSPFTITQLTYENGYTLQGLSGITLSASGQKLFISEYTNNTIKIVDLVRDVDTSSLINLKLTTLAGFDNISGHYDGSTDIALLSRPRALSLNKVEDSLYFIDGSTIRYINLENLNNSSALEVNTVAGNPFQTGIINGSGTRSRFLTPYYMQYRSLNGVDVLYISDYLGNNIREFRP
ncbi:FG-GAP-like repeat-containing protein, partial [bacterium]|nr:FG-GAP-like repeat-containing protein [bacterium]